MTSLHEAQEVVRAGKSLDEASAAIIVIHGRGATARSIVPLGRALGAENHAILAPQAADIAHVPQWYPQRFTAPKEENEPYLSSALNMLGQLVQEVLDAGISEDRLILSGFSQGACLTSEFAAQNPTRYGGLLIFSGGLIGGGPEVSEEMYGGSLESTPVFIGCSDRDPHIPLERVQETTQILTSLGAEVTEKIYPNMAHTVNENELVQARAIVEHSRR